MTQQLKEKPKAPLGEYFMVSHKIEGSFIVKRPDRQDKLMSAKELADFEKDNTRLDTNDYFELFPPVQAMGKRRQSLEMGTGGVSADVINAAFEFMKTKIAALEERLEVLEAKRGPGRPPKDSD